MIGQATELFTSTLAELGKDPDKNRDAINELGQYQSDLKFFESDLALHDRTAREAAQKTQDEQASNQLKTQGQKLAGEKLKLSFDRLGLVERLQRLDATPDANTVGAAVVATLNKQGEERKKLIEEVEAIQKSLVDDMREVAAIETHQKRLDEIDRQVQAWQDEYDCDVLVARVQRFNPAEDAPNKAQIDRFKAAAKADPNAEIDRVNQFKTDLLKAERTATERDGDRRQLAGIGRVVDRWQADLKNVGLVLAIENGMQGLVAPKAGEEAAKAITERLAAATARTQSIKADLAKLLAGLPKADRTIEQAIADHESLSIISQSVQQVQTQYELIEVALSAPGKVPAMKEPTAEEKQKALEELARNIAGTAPFKQAYDSLPVVKDPKDDSKELTRMFPQKLTGEDQVNDLITNSKVLGTKIAEATKKFLTDNAGNLKDGESVSRLILLACLVEEMRRDVNVVTGKLQVLATADQTAKSASEQATWARRESATLKEKLSELERVLLVRLQAVETKSVAINELQKSSADMHKQMTETDQSIAKQIESLESRVGAVKERIEIVRIEPRPLPDSEREKLAKEAAEKTLTTMLKWGYIPPQWSTPGIDAKPTAENKAEARKHFVVGREAFASQVTGSPEKSLRELSQAVTLDPTAPLYRFYLGLALYRDGQFDDAAEQVRQGATLEGPPKAGSLASELEPIQGSQRRWLDQIRNDIRSRLEQPLAKR